MSGIATGTALMIGGGLAAGGSIASGIIGSNAAGDAASTQANAADKAAQLQYQASQNALDFQKQQWQQSQNNMQPWLQGGANGLANLQYLLGVGPNPGGQGGQGGGGATNGFPPAQGSPMLPPGAGGGVEGNSGAHIAGVATGGGLPTAPGGGFPTARAGVAQAPAGVAGAEAGGGPTSGAVPAQGAQGGMYRLGSPTGANGGAAQAASLNGQVDPSLGGYGSLMQGYGKEFTSPDAITEQNDPGYQARLNFGTDAIQRSAAARGNVLTGGTAKALNSYAQDYASNEYGNVYNRAYNNYATGYNQFEQNQTNQYNRLAALAGLGQQSASQLGMMGQNASNNVSNNLLGTAANMGQQYNNAGAANASGIVGGANAWGGAIGNGANSLQQLMMLNQLYGGGGGGYNGNIQGMANSGLFTP